MGKWQLNMEAVQEWGEEVEEGVVYGVSLHREPASPVNDPLGPFCCVQYRTLKVRRVKAASLERLVSELVKPECHEPDFPRIFLSTYRAFTSTTSLIELLFQREDMISNLDNSVCVRSSLPVLLRVWLEDYVEDLRDSPHHQALRLLCVHLRHRLCFRRLARQAESLLHTFQEQDKQVGSEGSAVSASPFQLESAGDASPLRDREKLTASLQNFSARDIAEQLTRLDADLFVHVVPFHCLGCVWSQRDKDVNVAPSVRATIAQFNAVTSWVITSLLCPPSVAPHQTCISPQTLPQTPSSPKLPKSPRAQRQCQSAPCPFTSPAQRAHVIDKWISVAQECHVLRNFSSLRAILSALQSNAIYRLKKSWSAVSRESLSKFDQLCESFPDENCVVTSRELLEDCKKGPEDGTPPTSPKSPKLGAASRLTNCSSGEVPYLGTYLTVLTMLDTALPDTVEGGLVNFEKRRREFEILAHIRQLQASCSLYSLPSHRALSTWLRGCTPLSDQQSYDLSRELESSVDPYPNSPSIWSQRLITKKLCSLLSGCESSLKKTNMDQISVSSSGSSGCEMEDLSSPLRPKSQSGSCHNLSSATDSVSSSPSPRCSSPVPDAPQQEPCDPSCSGPASDCCIIRVSMEAPSANVYKSILISSQDKTCQVVQRALDKHHVEELSCTDFSLTQVLPDDRELLIPDKANVFYAMCPSISYDFVLRQRWRNHGQTPNSRSGNNAAPKGRRAK